MSDPPEQLTHPGVAGSARNWKLIAHNARVRDGWRALCRQLPGNALRCYDWLTTNPSKPIPGRCYALKHKRYVEAGVWGYEIGSGERIYYTLRLESREVLVYYAGPHPRKAVPYPPSE